ncbi:cold shock domain-containing protein [Maritimibacter sp. UBA3975]|uniref:cold-shock protein n=1 Tax=Maritimibacter sp. UBA3975 TaxID=1946833 RepID=UPI000C0B28E3|nr:cold shock domain-containing protein [Maritimibacter sp. UBA3975]MAM60618.1 cold-shock protein [Maritimibacter sp.]|tara:strand:+ start:8450 stop:8980 length:531 start_codon:yes stop_codon:yes gene_type:complete
MDDDDTSGQLRLTGFVKWFDPSKGFGFVVSDRGGPDILLHANVLRNYGQSSVADQARIEIVVQETPRGMQAVEVVSISAPDIDDEDISTFSEDLDLSRADPLEPARVKWFDKGKGFGFANVFGKAEDVFIHVEVLRRSGLADLQAGEAIGLRAAKGERGRMALLVTAWDAALDGEE